MGFLVFLFAALIAFIAQAATLTWLVAGFMGWLLFRCDQRIKELEVQLRKLAAPTRHTPTTPHTPTQPQPRSEPAPQAAVDTHAPPQGQPWQQPHWIPATTVKPAVAPASESATPAPQPTERETRLSSLYAPEHTEVSVQHSSPSAFTKFLRTGNPIARIGGLLLFLGVGFGLKFAADEGYFKPEIRLIAAALFSMVLLAFGVQVRNTKRQFSVIIQGTGVGIFYITTYIACARYELISPILALMLLSGTTILTGVLAVVGNARALAILALFGGFLAPILSHQGNVDHVGLFSYLAILNVGICAMCWFRSWRSINLTGFLFTFLISATWALGRYTPDHYLSCQIFLIFFAAIFTAINILYSVRDSASSPRYLDAAMTFGTPILCSLLQWSLTAHFKYGTALSCLGFGSAYILLARALHTTYRERLRELVDGFLAIGVILLTASVPFLVDRADSSAIFALEGGALVWGGIRNRRIFSRIFGIVLLLSSTLLFLSDPPISVESIGFLNQHFFSIALLTVAFIWTGGLLIHAPEDSIPSEERSLGELLVSLGCIGWAIGGWHEVTRHVPAWLTTWRAVFEPLLEINSVSFYIALYSLFATTSVYLFYVIFTQWKLPGKSHLTALFLIAHIGLLGFSAISWYFNLDGERYNLLGVPGILTWPLFFVVLAVLVFRQEREDPDVQHPRHHTFALWIACFLVTRDLALLVARYAASGWVHASIIAVPAIIVFFVSTALKAPTRWPLSRNQKIYCTALSAPLGCSVFFSLLFSLSSSCQTFPIPYLPLLNPLDLAQICTVLALWSVVMRAQELGVFDPATVDEARTKKLYVGFGIWIWIWITSTLLRTLHHLIGIRWDFWALFHSTTVQTSLSIFWTIAALALMLLSQRTRRRLLWKSGAVLIGVVVTKLFLVDLVNHGTLGRIVAFLGVGVLLLGIGYVAPIPPERTREP